MARRDRREVYNRLVVLLAPLLKWEYQPDRRSGSWLATILEQQRELRFDLESDTLHDHALALLADTYGDARELAAAGLPPSKFPDESPWDLDGVLADRGEGT